MLEYILRKALNDYSYFNNYDMPKVSKDMLEEFKRENDSVKSFIDDEFLNWKVERIPVELVYHAYVRYCETNGFYSVSSNVFTRKATYLLTEYKKVSSRLTAKHVNKISILAKDDGTSIRSDIKNDYYNINKQCFVIK